MEVEGYGGGHRHGRRGHGRGRRRWWGPRWGYRYRRPAPVRYVWYSPWNWYKGICKKGCTSIGNGNWGCEYAGRGANDCWFASDCYGCGY